MMMVTSQKFKPDAGIICQQNLNVDVSAPIFESITTSKALINNTGAPACGRRWNWFTKSYESTQEILKTEGEKEEEQADANKENPEPEEEEEEEEEEIKEPEEEKEDKMTLEEYEKLLKEKRKPLQLLKPLGERKVDTRAFEAMVLLPSKKGRDQFTKVEKKKKKNNNNKKKDKKGKEAPCEEKFFLRRRRSVNISYKPGSIGYEEILARAKAKKPVLSPYDETGLFEDEREYPILGFDHSKCIYGVPCTSLRLELLSLQSSES